MHIYIPYTKGNKAHINGTLCNSANAVLEMYTCTYSGLIVSKDTSEPAHFGVILLLHRGYPPSEVKLCCQDTVGTTEIALYTYVVRKNVTRFAKTRHNDAFLEIQIFASMNSIYLKLCSVVIPMLYCKYFSSYKAR